MLFLGDKVYILSNIVETLLIFCDCYDLMKIPVTAKVPLENIFTVVLKSFEGILSDK